MAIRGGPDIIEDGLVLHLDAADRNSYPLTGNIWYDLSGNGNNGTFGASTAAPTFSSSNGGVLSFDGGDEIQKDSFSITPQNNELSICLWYLTSNNANNSMLIDLCNSDTPSTNRDRFSIRQNWSSSSPVANRISCYFRNSTASFFYAYLPDQVVTNTWNHIGYTKNGNTLYAYLNGQQVANKSVSGDIAAINRLIIGDDNISSNRLTGKVSLVSV